MADMTHAGRKLKRRHLIFYLRVFDIRTGELVGQIVNITVEGMMLVRERPIELGQTMQLRMALPSEIDGTYEVRFNAKSLWCRKDVNPDFYVAGFHFENITPRDQDVIESLVQALGFQD